MNLTKIEKHLFIFSLIAVIISGGLIGLFFYLQNNSDKKINSEYTKVNFTVTGYYVVEQQCQVCTAAPCISPKYAPCSYCNWVPWTSYVIFSYVAVYNRTISKYKASIGIDCGTTSSKAMQNAQRDPYYPMKRNITGWYLNQDPNIYDLNNPAPYTYFPGIVTFIVSGVAFLGIAGRILVQAILEKCRGPPEEPPLRPSEYN